MSLKVFIGFIALLFVVNNVCSDDKSNLENDSNLDSQNALISVEDESDEEVLMNYTDEPIQYSGEIFTPTKEWQHVKENQAIPRGLHVRLNVQTGEREAKLLDEGEDVSQQQKNQHVRLDKHELLKESMQQAMVELENGDDYQQEATEEIKYWKQGDKQGMMNTKQPFFTHSELKRALKKFKATKDEAPNPDEDAATRQKFRSMEEIREDFKSLRMDMKTDLEILKEVLTAYKMPDLTSDERVAILTDLEYYVHQIDNAQNFALMGGLQLVVADLNSTSEEVRSEAAFVLGSAVQSNPRVQIDAIESGALHQLVRMLSTETSLSVRVRVLSAISSLVRHFPYAQRKFLELGGLQALSHVVIAHDGSEKMWVKAITLVNDLLVEQVNAREEIRPTRQVEEKMSQYEKVRIHEAVIERGWCGIIPTFLRLQEHDSREKVLAAMVTLKDSCSFSYAKHVPVLRELQNEYSKLSATENREDDSDTYFTDILSMIDQLLARHARDEL